MSITTRTRRLLAVASSAAIALALASCSAGGSATAGDDGTYELVFATGEAEGSPNVTPTKRFMEEVTERTDGRVTWQTHYSGSLIPSTEIAKAVKDGRIDAGILTSP
jgi:TRAP-type C4-dicarboxylate transport system substrate-binding protein